MRDLSLLEKLPELSPIPATGDFTMKNTDLKKLSHALLTILLILGFSLPSNYADAAGRSAKSVANTILNGKGAPKISTGIDGDFYIDTRSLLMYGPKKKGRWPVPSNLQGPTGPTGNPGKSGNDGKTISSASTTSGPQGPQGPVGPKGEAGSPGAPGFSGSPGPAGPAGQDGAAGLPGSSGPAGSSGGSGPAGATGPAGSVGATGATGAQGPAGPSEVTVVDIPEWILSSASPFAFTFSPAFANLLAGRSYSLQINLNGTSSFNNLVLGLELSSPGSTVNYSYSRNDFRYALSSSIRTGYGFDVTGVVQTGSSDSHLVVKIIDGLGDTGNATLTVRGTAYITLVGSIR